MDWGVPSRRRIINPMTKYKTDEEVEEEYKVLPSSDWEFILELRHQDHEAVIEEIEKLITEEILICHQENTPTSRLTSLAMKIKTL